MKLSEITDNETVFTIMANRLLRKHTIYMWALDSEGGDVKVEVESVEDGGNGWVIVHYGVVNSRTGDVQNWERREFREHEVTISQEGKEWWLHEAE